MTFLYSLATIFHDLTDRLLAAVPQHETRTRGVADADQFNERSAGKYFAEKPIKPKVAYINTTVGTM